MYDMELNRKKCQREAWIHERNYINFKIKAGLRVRDILTEIPIEELRTLLEYAVKGIEQELQIIPSPSYKELNEVEKAHDVMITFINSIVGMGKFPKDRTLQELSEGMKTLKHFIARLYLDLGSQGV